VPLAAGWHSQRSHPRKNPSNFQTINPGDRSITVLRSVGARTGTFSLKLNSLPLVVFHSPTGSQTSAGFSHRCMSDCSVKQRSTLVAVVEIKTDCS